MAATDKLVDAVLDELAPLTEVIDEVQCSRTHLCALLNSGRLEGRKIGTQWFVFRRAIPALRDSLTTRSAGKRHLAKRPAAGR